MSAAESELVSYRVSDDVACLQLNNPPVNIMSAALMQEMSAHLETIAADRDLKALAVTAAGKAFCAGADVGEHRPDKVQEMIGAFGRLFRQLDALEIPVVMAVGGVAMGAGFELILMADVLLASAEAVFGQPEIRLGFFAPVGVVELPALVGRAKAMEITCTGRNYSAAEMARMGLVASVVGADELDGALAGVLKDIRRASPLVLRLNTRTLKRSRAGDFAATLAEAERVFLEELMTSRDPVEGIEAFYAKRRPEWTNS
ncbi:enoyl-CoA hydratase/isomerase family protein [bacterium]|nr:enoyl-CoA hydratase/isomerase family protein [bacterium]MBU1072027.1 enoyl-CoA hydratase/isomerase family protein [bacterium]MBU1676578.1 enoyl-CoA hydratase/isomerase family protein [bacterium]